MAPRSSSVRAPAAACPQSVSHATKKEKQRVAAKKRGPPLSRSRLGWRGRRRGRRRGAARLSAGARIRRPHARGVGGAIMRHLTHGCRAIAAAAGNIPTAYSGDLLQPIFGVFGTVLDVHLDLDGPSLLNRTHSLVNIKGSEGASLLNRARPPPSRASAPTYSGIARHTHPPLHAPAHPRRRKYHRRGGRQRGASVGL